MQASFTLAPRPPKPEFHPDFASEDADVVLTSKDDVSFRTYSLFLRKSSTFFRDTLSLPQPTSQTDSHDPFEHRVHLDETADTIERVLRMISFMEVPPLDSLQVIDPLLYALDKYGMPGPTSVIRIAIMLEKFLIADAVWVYAIACRYGWIHEAGVAAKRTLGVDILAAISSRTSKLETLNGKDLISLLLIHVEGGKVLKGPHHCTKKHHSPATRRECRITKIPPI
jgi:hypothetical protein